MDEPWEYRELTDKEIDSCIEFSAEFYNKNDNADDPSAVVEQYAIDILCCVVSLRRITQRTSASSTGKRI